MSTTRTTEASNAITADNREGYSDEIVEIQIHDASRETANQIPAVEIFSSRLSSATGFLAQRKFFIT